MGKNNFIFELYLASHSRACDYSYLIQSIATIFGFSQLFIIPSAESGVSESRLVVKSRDRQEWIFQKDPLSSVLTSSVLFFQNLGASIKKHQGHGSSYLMIVGYHHQSNPWRQQSSWYRVLSVGQALEMQGHQVFYHAISEEDLLEKQILSQSWSSVIFHRVDDGAIFRRLLKVCHEKKIPTVMDIDDLVFDEVILDTHFACREMSWSQRRAMKEYIHRQQRAMALCDRVFVSTQELLTKALTFQSASEIRYNWIPDFYTSFIDHDQKSVKENSTLRLFYGAGSLEHQYFFKILSDGLHELFQNDRNVILYLGGGLQVPSVLKKFQCRIVRVPKILPEAYMSLLVNMDIALAPLGEDIFSQGKSWIKGLEAICAGSYWLSSKNSNYKILENQFPESGKVVASPMDWGSELQLAVNKMRQGKRQKTLASHLKASAHIKTYFEFLKSKV